MKVTDIGSWTDAFLIFTSIYSSVHITRTQELLKYMNNIRLAEKRHKGLGWYYYDQQFRLRMGRDPSRSWGKIDSELWLLYISSPEVSVQKVTNPVPSRGKCFDFNYKSLCTRPSCRFLHNCIECNGGHP